MAIDREKVIEQMSKISVEANEDGLIPAFNVLVNQFSARFWNQFTKRLVEAVDDDIKNAGEKMIVRAYDFYEADIAEDYPGKKSPRLSAHMINGVCAAFMDLAYGGKYDPAGKTGLYTFRGSQTKGIECGDKYGEFVVGKSEHYA